MCLCLRAYEDHVFPTLCARPDAHGVLLCVVVRADGVRRRRRLASSRSRPLGRLLPRSSPNGDRIEHETFVSMLSGSGRARTREWERARAPRSPLARFERIDVGVHYAMAAISKRLTLRPFQECCEPSGQVHDRNLAYNAGSLA